MKKREKEKKRKKKRRGEKRRKEKRKEEKRKNTIRTVISASRSIKISLFCPYTRIST